jgi:hypothetical protein
MSNHPEQKLLENDAIRRERRALRREVRKLREELIATHALNKELARVVSALFAYDAELSEFHKVGGEYGLQIMFANPIADDFHIALINFMNDVYKLQGNLNTEENNEQG